MNQDAAQDHLDQAPQQARPRANSSPGRSARLQELLAALQALRQENEALTATLQIREEQRFQALIENSSDAIALVDTDGVILYASPSTTRLLGYELREYVGHNGAEFTHPDEQERLAQWLAELAQNPGGRLMFEYRLRHKDGSWRWMEAVGQNLLHNPSVRAIVTNYRDITERKRAEADRARYAAQLRELAQVSWAIGSALTLEEVLQIVTEHARKIIGAHQSVTSLTAGESFAQDISSVSLSDKYAAYRGYSARPDGSGIYVRVCRENRAMRLTQAELEAHPGWRGFGPEAGAHPPMRGWLAAPLVGREGQNLGLIQLSDRYEGEFTADDEAMLVQLAQIAAVAVENARLFAAEQHALHIAETLRAANIALTQLFNLDTVLETLLDYLAQLVPYDSANVMLIEDGSRVVLRARRGYERWTDPTRLEGLTLDTETTPTLRTLIQTRQSLIIADTQQYAGWQPLPETAHIRSWMGVPLTAAGEVIGLYAVDKAVPDFFTPDHLRSAETLAAQAAVAIENALLFEQVRAGRERLRQLAQQVIAAQEEERQRLSRELHDQVGQNLTALLLTLNALEENHPAPPEAERLLNHTRGLADQMLRDLHRLAWELRPAALDDLGLETALRQYAEDSTQRAGLRLDFHCHGLRDRRLPPHVETTLYRVVQEALTNVVRHARASRVSVLLGADADRARAIVEDDGQGFEVEAALNTPRLGLLGMEERVALVNGALTIEASPGAGTTVYVNVPLGH